MVLKVSSAVAAVAFVGVSLLAVGATALVAPETASAMYGVPAGAAPARAYVWATGTRDLAIGAWLLALVALRVRRRVLGASMLVTAVVPVGDALIVLAAGAQNAAALALHGSAVVFFLVVGAWLWRGDGGKGGFVK